MKLNFYSVGMVLLFVIFGISLTDVQAAPMIRLSPIWRPASQLSSIDANGDGITDSGDDIRYVMVDIYATVNVEFWAVGLVCTVNRAVLESYVQNGDPNSTDDTTPMFTEGAAWGQVTKHSVDTVDADGKLSIALTVSEERFEPMGSNGFEETIHLATLRFRVREDLAAAGNSPFTCVSNFLNRDGRKVLNAEYAAPAPLNVYTGYTFSGNVSYQAITVAATNPQAIQVTCDDADGDLTFDDVVTTANITTGAFSVNNLRTQGRYDCFFVPNILNNAVTPDAIHLTAQTDFNLTTAAFTLMPIYLKNGNVDTASSPTVITTSDIAMVTSNWNAPATTLTAPFMFGDATGDRKINEMDLAVVSGNRGRIEPYHSHHILYSVARDASASFNNHLLIGEINNPSLRLFGTNTTRDYWPAVSPAGNRIAFVRNLGTNGADVFALFTAPITNGVMGAATRISAVNATYDVFAPSWSPDGSQIAFVCSYNDDWFDVSAPVGNFCLIDAAGQNFRRLTNTGTANLIVSKIQAPAWFDETRIYYANAVDPLFSTLSDKLVLLDVPNSLLAGVMDLPAGSDMPYIRNTVMGPTLFYRFDNGTNHNIRFVELNTGNALPAASYPSTVANAIHEDAKNSFPSGSALSTTVAYFTVSTGADPEILFYNYQLTLGDTGGSSASIRIFNGTSSAPNWQTLTAGSFPLPDAFSSPAYASGYNEAIPNTAVFLP